MSDPEKDIKPRGISPTAVMINRREFTKLLGAGILMTVGGTGASAKQGAKTQAASSVSDRLHVGVNGIITVMTGKVDIG